LEGVLVISAFGVEHGDISKARGKHQAKRMRATERAANPVAAAAKPSAAPAGPKLKMPGKFKGKGKLALAAGGLSAAGAGGGAYYAHRNRGL
jgi:hypothetical protein